MAIFTVLLPFMYLDAASQVFDAGERRRVIIDSKSGKCIRLLSALLLEIILYSKK